MAGLVFLLIGAALTRAAEVDAAAQGAAPTETMQSLPAGPRGRAIAAGRLLVSDTARLLPDAVGNGLTCSNCHLGAGTVAHASPWKGIWGVFPEYRSRSGKMISLQERINDCMQRSMNGKPLAYDSAPMNAMLAYIQWLSQGMPTGVDPPGRGFGPINSALIANAEHGARVYAGRCAACHGPDGAGVQKPDGSYAFPPLWGDRSFNVGAGMARTYTAAAFILHNMPLGNPNTLSEQDAVDVAQFVTHQPRPEFPGRHLDWPARDAPPDARLE